MVILFYLVFLSFLYNDALLPLSKKTTTPKPEKKQKKQKQVTQGNKIKKLKIDTLSSKQSLL